MIALYIRCMHMLPRRTSVFARERDACFWLQPLARRTEGEFGPVQPRDRVGSWCWNRVELGFLLIAGVIAFAIPASGQIHLALGLTLLGWFGFYLYKVSHGEVEEPDLIGTAAALGELSDRSRRIAVSMRRRCASHSVADAASSGALGSSPLVLNLSFGGDEDPVQHAAIDYAIAHGVIVVAGAGNQGEGGMVFPAASQGGL